MGLDALVSAQETGTFTFTKRKSRNFLYEHLSAGEKGSVRSTARRRREQDRVRRFSLLR